jgi:type I restriction enzyme M protein
MNLYLHGIEEPNIVDVDAQRQYSGWCLYFSSGNPFKGNKLTKKSVVVILKNVTDTFQ